LLVCCTLSAHGKRESADSQEICRKSGDSTVGRILTNSPQNSMCGEALNAWKLEGLSGLPSGIIFCRDPVSQEIVEIVDTAMFACELDRVTGVAGSGLKQQKLAYSKLSSMLGIIDPCHTHLIY